MNVLNKHFHSPALGLFIIRLIAGLIFVYAGVVKLMDVPMTAGFFATVGLGTAWVYIVAILEIIGGASFILGIFSRVFGLILAVIMAVATILSAKTGGINMAQTPLIMLAVSVAVLLSGCGRYSVCGWRHKDCSDCKNNKCSCEHGM